MERSRRNLVLGVGAGLFLTGLAVSQFNYGDQPEETILRENAFKFPQLPPTFSPVSDNEANEVDSDTAHVSAIKQDDLPEDLSATLEIVFSDVDKALSIAETHEYGDPLVSGCEQGDYHGNQFSIVSDGAGPTSSYAWASNKDGVYEVNVSHLTGPNDDFISVTIHAKFGETCGQNGLPITVLRQIIPPGNINTVEQIGDYCIPFSEGRYDDRLEDGVFTKLPDFEAQVLQPAGLLAMEELALDLCYTDQEIGFIYDRN